MEMHSLLSSALESNTKNTEKINILKVKLADSENLNTALTQSVNLNFTIYIQNVNISTTYNYFFFFYIFRILKKLQC